MEYSEICINFVVVNRNMARNLTGILTDLRKQFALLARQKDQAERERDDIRKEAERLKGELEDCRRERDMARMEVDFLTVSYRLADDPDHLIQARRRLQRLIAKIDRCVSLLKDDADIC